MRTYSEQERAEAVGLAMAIGCPAAAERTGIPRRTISYWLQHSGQVVKIEPTTTEQIAAKLWEAVVTGTDAVLDGLRDPKARLSDKAQALRVVAEQHALMTGRATANLAVRGNISAAEQALDGLGDTDRELVRKAIDEALIERREAEAAGVVRQLADPLADLSPDLIRATIGAIEERLARTEAES